MIREKRIWLSIKYFLYTLILFILYAMQTTSGILEIGGIRPIWVLPFAMALAMCEGVLAGAVFGALSGLLCDMGTQALFGFNGFLMLCGCVAISLLSIFLIKINWKSALLLGSGLAAARALLEFFFFYLIWGYEDIYQVFFYSVCPMFVYTAALTPLFLLLVRHLKETCDSQWRE